jgi:phosphomannomutase
MLNRLAARYGLDIYETPVGFNHITDHMLREPVLIGGEESGGISILGHIPEGDGLLMGLLLAEIVAVQRKPLGVLLDELMAAEDVGVFRYARIDQPVRPFKKSIGGRVDGARTGSGWPANTLPRSATATASSTFWPTIAGC